MPGNFVTYGKTEISGISDGTFFTASNTESASGKTIQESLDSLYYTSKKTTEQLLDNINGVLPPKITDYKLNVNEIVILNGNDSNDNNSHNDSDIIIKQQTELQKITKDDYYYTYYDKEFISYEPTQYSNDVFSVSFNFWFSEEDKIYPYFYFVKDNVTYEKKLNTFNTTINGFINITFGPFQKMIQENRPEEVYIAIKTSKNIIFFKHHKIINFDDYSYKIDNLNNPINLNMMLVSCWSLPGYRGPAPLQPELYDKLTETAREENADFILSTGDLVYLEPLNIMSKTAVQAAYTQLKDYPRLQGTFSNHTWINCNDDHEFSYNDGNKNGPIIKVLRDTFSNNFPILSQVSPDYRADIRTVKNVTFITLDSVSCRTLNPNPVDYYDKYLTILGPNQLQFLKDALSNVYMSFDEKALCFILVGKTMFGVQSEFTFLFCQREREEILNYIKSIGLRNVCFLCGDSHFSDVSEYVLNAESNQIVREIRCSAIGSKPRVGDINVNRVEGSLVNKNNFGRINVNGTYKDYTILYSDYTVDGVVYSYGWNINY